ncbi:helix-turn-helix domain-containing protein [Nocardia sp. NPDC059240]|uniref:helix-turn-helix domain-containing protein n=1 Tax=Nocardia sp. NPDC059240 TaxID=3346786 RepID=UPI0036C60CC1
MPTYDRTTATDFLNQAFQDEAAVMRVDPPEPGDNPLPYIPVDKAIGANVLRYREAAGLSQTALSRRLSTHGMHIAQRQISELENGNRTLKLTEAVALTHALRITIDQLLAGVQFAGNGQRSPHP